MRALVRYVGRHHVGLLALFFALTGSAYAAGVARNSVGTAQLKNGAVTSPKVKDGSLRVRDFAAADRALLRGPAGQQGTPGPAGATGPAGPAGRDGGALIDAQSFPAQPDPPSHPDQMSGTALTFNLPAAGKVNLSAYVQVGGSCPMGGADCTFAIGLYLDGKPVPHSESDLTTAPGVGAPSCADESGAAFGSSAQMAGVTAGQHTLTVGFSQTAGTHATVNMCAAFGEATGPYL